MWTHQSYPGLKRLEIRVVLDGRTLFRVIVLAGRVSRRRQPGFCGNTTGRHRNEVERLFRRLKGFRRVFSRYDRPDVIFPGFIVPALVVDSLRSVNKTGGASNFGQISFLCWISGVAGFFVPAVIKSFADDK